MSNKLTLGSFTFPIAPKEKLSFNTSRELVKLDIPGAPVDYQDMGDGETPISWSGNFEGDDAFAQCMQVRALKESGKVQRLLYGLIDTYVSIKSFNYEILRWDKITYTIELVEDKPVEKKAQSSNQATASSSTKGANVQQSSSYTVKKGDSLWSIAQNSKSIQNGSQWPVIAKLNNISDPNALQIGQVLKMPASKEEAAAIAKSISAPTKPNKPKPKPTVTVRTAEEEKAYNNWFLTEKGYQALTDAQNEWNLASQGYT